MLCCTPKWVQPKSVIKRIITCDKILLILSLTSVKIKYQFFTSVSIWYWFFTFVKFEYQFFTGVKNWYRFFTSVKIEYQFFTSEKNRTSPSQMARMRTNSSQLKMRKMWNLSTYVRPPKLSKLTIRKFHIFQKWRFGTNSSQGVKFAKCEICGLTKLRTKEGWLYFNKMICKSYSSTYSSEDPFKSLRCPHVENLSPTYPLSALQIFLWDWEDAHADLSLRTAHSVWWFCHVFYHTGLVAIENVNTIDERRSKNARNIVFDCHLSPDYDKYQNTVSSDFWSAVVDC